MKKKKKTLDNFPDLPAQVTARSHFMFGKESDGSQWKDTA